MAKWKFHFSISEMLLFQSNAFPTYTCKLSSFVVFIRVVFQFIHTITNNFLNTPTLSHYTVIIQSLIWKPSFILCTNHPWESNTYLQQPEFGRSCQMQCWLEPTLLQIVMLDCKKKKNKVMLGKKKSTLKSKCARFGKQPSKLIKCYSLVCPLQELY